jgi:hypothetical protein
MVVEVLYFALAVGITEYFIYLLTRNLYVSVNELFEDGCLVGGWTM